MRSTIDRPRPRPRAILRALVEAVEFAEDVALLRLRNADAGVVDVDAQAGRLPAAADQHAAVRRVLDRVGDEILQQPAQQPPVGAHRPASTARTSGRGPLARAIGANSTSIWRIRSSMRKRRDLRPHRAGIEPRNVEQRAEDFLDRFERGVDIVRPAARPRRPLRARPGWSRKAAPR